VPSFTTTFMDGVAQYLENSDVGVFHSSGVAYTANQVGIFFDAVPASPDRVIVLTGYAATDDPTQPETVLSLQVRVRGPRQDPRIAYELDDAAFDALQNLPRSHIGGTTVAGIWRASSAYMGVDANGRHERVSNYTIRLHRPTLHRV
jgi:hypothetical protein